MMIDENLMSFKNEAQRRMTAPVELLVPEERFSREESREHSLSELESPDI